MNHSRGNHEGADVVTPRALHLRAGERAHRTARARVLGLVAGASTIAAACAAGLPLTSVDAATQVTARPAVTPTFLSDISNPGGVAPLYPAGGATDSSGTMWIADSGGSRVDRIDSHGNLSYVTPTSGAPLSNPRNLSLDVATPTDMWITDTGNNGLVEMTTSGTVL